MAFKIGSVQLSKWQLALVIGAPLAIGIGLYAYKSSPFSNSSSSVKGKDKSKGDGDSKKSGRYKTQGSIDGNNVDKELESKKKNAELGNEKLSPLKEANIYKTEGNLCYRNGKFDEAILFYDKALEKCPEENRTDMAIFYQNRAASYEMLRKWSNVKNDCSRSLEYNPRYAKAYFRRAKAHEATNDMMECLNDVTAACILEMFQNNNTIIYADRILKHTGREDAENELKNHVPIVPSASFVSTYFRSFTADPIQTMTLPESVLSKKPLHGFARAKVSMEEEQYDEIVSACTEEIESSESESQYKTEALLLRGTMFLLSGSFNESLQDLDAVINNSDADLALRTNALIKRASLHIQQSEKDPGLADFAEAEKLQPNNPDIFLQRAQTHMLIDQLPEALEEFEKAVKGAPHHAMAYVQKCYAEYRIALISQDQMRLMMVMNEFKNAIEKFPNCVECYSLMAQVLGDQQQFQQADHFYEKTLKMAPNNASLYVHRGILALQWKGDIERAIELINKALEVDEKCELAYETLGTIEVQRANLQKAVELFEKAISLAKNKTEMCHLFALRNAAVAQINVTKKLGIDMSTISALTQSGVVPVTTATQ